MKTFAAVALAVVALAGCGSEEEEESEAPSGAPVQTVQINETEYRLQPATVTLAKAGIYTFHAVNKGTTEHALEIEGNDLESETAELAPGESADLKVTLEKGTYEIYCPVSDHKERGMKGSVAVGGATAGTSGTSTDDDDSGDDDGYGTGYG